MRHERNVSDVVPPFNGMEKNEEVCGGPKKCDGMGRFKTTPKTNDVLARGGKSECLPMGGRRKKTTTTGISRSPGSGGEGRWAKGL